MSLISWHILRSFVMPFIWGLLALTGLLLVTQLPRLIDAFGGNGLGAGIMIEAIILAIPAVVTLTLPMATLVATLYAFTSLTTDSEVVALYSNGVSVWRMARPAILTALVVGAVNFLLFDQIVPLSNTRFRSLNRDVFTKTPTLALKPQELNPLPRSSYIIRASTIDPSGAMTGVTIWDLKRYEGRRIIHADSGTMSHSADGRDLLMVLYHGNVLDFPVGDPVKVERTTFVRNRLRIAGIASELARSDAQAERGGREKSGCQLLDDIEIANWDLNESSRQRAQLARRDLRHLLSLPPAPPPPIQTRPEFPPRCSSQWREFQTILERLLLPRKLEAATVQRPVDTLPKPKDTLPRDTLPKDTIPRDSLLKLRKLAVEQQAADSVAGAALQQKPVTDREETFEFPEAQTEQQDQRSVQDEFEQSTDGESPGWLVDPIPVGGPRSTADGVTTTMAEVRGARLYSLDATRTIRDYDVEYHKKFAIPLASVAFVMVGLALALKVPGGGIGLVIGGSLIIFLGLYVFLIGGENIAKQGHLSAAVAMYTPVAVLTVIGFLAVHSANRELGSNRSGSLFESIRQLFVRRRHRR